MTDYDPLPDIIRVWRTSSVEWRAYWLCQLNAPTLDRALKLLKVGTARELVESLKARRDG